MLTTQKPEEHLIASARRGEQRAYMELYRRYSPMVYRTSLQFMKHSGEAEDAAQESFIKAFERLNEYRAEASFGSWLKRITIHRCLDKLKASRMQMDELDDNILQDEHEEDWDEERYSQVIECIRDLPDGYRVVLTLYLLEGYDHEEIGEILGIKPSASRSQFTRAKAKLREQMKSK